MKKILPLLLLCALLLSACAGSAGSTAPGGESTAASADAPADRTVITLNGTDVQISGGGARDTGSEIVISAAGTYEVRGVGQEKALVVDTGDDAMDVTVILNNAEIVCLSGPALHVRQAKHFRLQLAEGSQNRLVSGTEEMLQALDPEASGAALYSEDDMDIEGTGSLIVCGYLNNGIACKDDLDLNSGEIAVVAANNGVKGNDSVQVKGGSITISAWGDGIKSSTADKEGKGYVEISGGSVQIESWGDGIQAATELRLLGGSLSVVARGDGVTGSSKALKAAGDLLLDGCDVQLESLTDGARSESGSVSVSAGSLTVCAGGDGIQAGEKDSGLGDVSISGGSVEIHAGKQAVKARGSFAVTGGSVLALCGSEKQAGPAEGLPWLLCRLSGQAGDSVSANALSLTARLDYACLLVVDGSLSRGETVSVTNGSAAVEATVN